MSSLCVGKVPILGCIPRHVSRIESFRVSECIQQRAFTANILCRNGNKLQGRGRSEIASAGQQALETYDASVVLPTKMNTTPHPREMRQFFYDDVCEAVLRALKSGETRMSIRATFPELNPEMDVYRIGTMLEMIREMVTRLAADGQKVKVCVQQSLGQGVFSGTPLSLSGVMRIMQQMDWGSTAEFVSFGNYTAGEIDESKYYIMLSPQNVPGDSIIPFMKEMVEAAESQNKHVIIINPRLNDIPSANAVMGVRGRGDRMAFAASFLPAYHFRLLYLSGSIYPIMGALRYVYGQQWEVYRRKDLGRKLGEGEEYQLIGLFDKEPDSGLITQAFEKPRR